VSDPNYMAKIFRITVILFSWFVLLLSFNNEVPILAQSSEVMPADGTLRRIQVPILMYHYVSVLPPNADETRIGLTVEPALFEAHLNYFVEAGFNTISLYDLHRALYTGYDLPSNPVVLTFDDGYVDHYTNVFPRLQNHDFTATFFVITGRADNNDPNHLNWSQIVEMSNAGMSMEAHTKDHLGLSGRDYDFLVYQILGSVESLEAHTEQTVNMFSYPAGRYDETTLSVVRSLPIFRAVTTESGATHTTDNQLELPRLRITGNMSVAGLQHLLNSIR